MLDYRQVLAEPEKYHELLLRRGHELPLKIIEKLNATRLELTREVEELRRRLNVGSKEISKLRCSSEIDTRKENELREQMTQISEKVAELEAERTKVESQLESLMLEIPNIPAAHTPVGQSDQDNLVMRHWGVKPAFDFQPKSHYELAEKNGLLDFERGAKLAGTRFTVLRGAASRLERALMNLMLDMAVLEHGYTPVSVPYMVNRKTMIGTGQLPKFESDMFRVTAGDREWFLIPTAEVPVTNLHADEIIPEAELPLAYCSLTPCFRAEAGSAGRDIRGLIRQHQFDKVEMVRFTKPSESWKELDILTQHAENILQRLNLHYRVVALCTGDLGFAAQFTYDLEVWLPGQNAYREISSCSNYGDYQARRARIRYKRSDSGKNELVHTLNGSGMPIGRALIAVIEQNQRADGSIAIPEALQKYTGFTIIFPNGKTD